MRRARAERVGVHRAPIEIASARCVSERMASSRTVEDAFVDAESLLRECEETLERRDELERRRWGICTAGERGERTDDAEKGDDGASTSSSNDVEREIARLTAHARTRLNGVCANLAALDELVARRERTPWMNDLERRIESLRALERRKDLAMRRCASVRKKKSATTAVTWNPAEQAPKAPGVETRQRDKGEVLQIQRAMLEEQDDALDDLSRAAGRAKEISIAVNDELDLHAKLLDSLDDDMADTSGRLTRASRAVQNMMRRGSSCRSATIAVLVFVLCFLVLALIIKLQR